MSMLIFSVAAVFSSAVLTLSTAWYSLLPAWRHILIYFLVDAPRRVERARHLWLSERCSPPQFLNLVVAIQISSEWFVDSQFSQDGALEQFFEGWCPLHRLPKSRGCCFLKGLAIPESSNTRNPARGASEKKVIQNRRAQSHQQA